MDLTLAGLKKVRDFAQECGCTPQNIYGHLRTYAEDLEGHTFQGKGRTGVFLDEYAQEFLRSVMYPKELAKDTTVANLQAEIEKLRAALFQAGTQHMELSAKLAATEGERDRLQFDVKSYEKQLQIAEESEAAKQARIQELSQENHDLQVRAGEAEMRERQAASDRDTLAEENQNLKTELHGLAEDLAWAQKPWWQKFGKKQPARGTAPQSKGD